MSTWVRHAPGWSGLVMVALVAAGCAVAPRPVVPAELPNVTRQDFLTVRWALQHEGGSARAVGIAEPSSNIPWEAILDLYGVDGGGRIVSRGTTVVRPDFDSGATSFAIALAETGRETQFQLVVARSRQNTRPGD